MTQILTFEKVQKAYDEVAHYLEVNKVLLFHTARPEHATWIDESLLARLFYQSGCEWVKGFREIADNFSGNTGERICVSRMYSDLVDRLGAFKERILCKFGDNNKVAEELTA